MSLSRESSHDMKQHLVDIESTLTAQMQIRDATQLIEQRLVDIQSALATSPQRKESNPSTDQRLIDMQLKLEAQTQTIQHFLHSITETHPDLGFSKYHQLLLPWHSDCIPPTPTASLIRAQQESISSSHLLVKTHSSSTSIFTANGGQISHERLENKDHREDEIPSAEPASLFEQSDKFYGKYLNATS